MTTVNACHSARLVSASTAYERLLVILTITIVTEFTRGQEAPFQMSECHWPMECELSAGQTASWNWGFTVSPKVGKALKFGISGGYGEA